MSIWTLIKCFDIKHDYNRLNYLQTRVILMLTILMSDILMLNE